MRKDDPNHILELEIFRHVHLNYTDFFPRKDKRKRNKRLLKFSLAKIWSFNPDGHPCNCLPLRVIIVVASMIANFATNCTIQLCNHMSQLLDCYISICF